jgi:hypothetical protein
MTHLRHLATAACAALLCGTAAAQLKPPSGSPRVPAGPAAPAAAPAATSGTAPAPAPAPASGERETAAQLAAAGWLTLLDRRDWGTAWETSAAMFRRNVPLNNWMDGIPKVRADMGALVERTPAAANYKNALAGQPPGDYVTVQFASKFAQREVEEVVTTVLDPDGRWRVTGYSVR